MAAKTLIVLLLSVCGARADTTERRKLSRASKASPGDGTEGGGVLVVCSDCLEKENETLNSATKMGVE